MYSYCYVCSVLCILFRFVVLCIVCVEMCNVLLPPGVNPAVVNLQKPNDIYIYRTAAVTSRRYILYIYSTNIHTEYFKHAA